MVETGDGVIEISEPAGIDRDYIRAFGPVEEYIKVIREGRPNRWKNLARRAFIQRPTLRYGELFDTSRLDEGAAEAVARLDEIAGELDAIRERARDGDDIPLDRLTACYEEARRLIFAAPPPR